ncbi:MAG TPA: glycosyltransferase family 39 protein [Candidatus Sulfotelmatobacter sp.]
MDAISMGAIRMRAAVAAGERDNLSRSELFAIASPAANRRRRVLIVAVIALVCMVAVHGIGKGEFDYNVDEAQHGVTGLFVADALHDLPLAHPVEYAYRYYAQYPSVALVHWPPLFYVAEAFFFRILGPGVVAARITVLMFTILLLYQWFRLVEELQDSYTAAVCTAVLGLLPVMLLFEKTVMLEIPSLALAIAAIRSWIRYLDLGHRADVYAFGLWLAAALLCKQTDIFLLLFFVLSVIVLRKRRNILTRDCLLAIALCGILAGPFYLLMLMAQGGEEAHNLARHQLPGIARITFYVTCLPATLTLPLCLLSLMGIATAGKWNRRRQVAPMICWVIAGYLTFTFFGQKDSRFSIYFLPPLIYFAVGFLMRFFSVPRVRLAMRACALFLVGFLAVKGWAHERPYISGYKDAASYLIQTYGSGIVLFDGNVPGNFVFYMRALDPRRQFLTLRKSLYVSDIREDATSQELLHDRGELLDLFKRDGVRFVVIQDPERNRFQSQKILRDAMREPQFHLVKAFPVASNEPQWQGVTLLLYENMEWAAPLDRQLRIRMLTLSHDIVVPLDRFDFVKGRNKAEGQK